MYYSYHTHVTDLKSKTERLGCLLKVTQVVSYRVRAEIQDTKKLKPFYI